MTSADAVVVGGGTVGAWCAYYLRQRDEIGTDSGFTEQGYLIPCFTGADVAAARERMAMQAGLGVPVRWLDPREVDQVNPTLAPGQTLGGTFCAQDGYITPPRNVAAYTVALLRSGVEVAEHVAFRGLTRGGVDTSQERIDAGLVVLTGGPKLAEVGRLAGLRIPAGGVRHQV